APSDTRKQCPAYRFAGVEPGAADMFPSAARCEFLCAGRQQFLPKIRAWARRREDPAIVAHGADNPPFLGLGAVHRTCGVYTRTAYPPRFGNDTGTARHLNT